MADDLAETEGDPIAVPLVDKKDSSIQTSLTACLAVEIQTDVTFEPR